MLSSQKMHADGERARRGVWYSSLAWLLRMAGPHWWYTCRQEGYSSVVQGARHKVKYYCSHGEERKGNVRDHRKVGRHTRTTTPLPPQAAESINTWRKGCQRHVLRKASAGATAWV